MSEFLEAVKRGDIQGVKDIYDRNPEVAYEKDEKNRNALLLAVTEGQWKLSIVLLKYCHVSPHLLDNQKNSIFHLIPYGLRSRRPDLIDYAEIRAENMRMWTNEENKERARINEVYLKNSDIKPPENLLVKKAADLERTLFEPIDLFFPKYILYKYHVVLNRNNLEGRHPADVANQLGEAALGSFYQNESEPYKIRQRLVTGLNENLVRDIASFL